MGDVIWKGAAKRLDAIDYGRQGRLIGVGEDVIRAVVEVETSGGGFDSKGRVKILFEPHVFYRSLGEAKRRRAVLAGLAYAKWGEKAYPRDSYPRLEAAAAIDRAAALKSCSLGLGQILGENFKMAGYGSIDDMVESFAVSEANQLEAMVRWIEAAGLDDDLRRIEALPRASTAADWAPFARVYNGPGYARNAYHTKLAAAHAKWRKIPDAAA